MPIKAGHRHLKEAIDIDIGIHIQLPSSTVGIHSATLLFWHFQLHFHFHFHPNPNPNPNHSPFTPPPCVSYSVSTRPGLPETAVSTIQDLARDPGPIQLKSRSSIPKILPSDGQSRWRLDTDSNDWLCVQLPAPPRRFSFALRNPPCLASRPCPTHRSIAASQHRTSEIRFQASHQARYGRSSSASPFCPLSHTTPHRRHRLKLQPQLACNQSSPSPPLPTWPFRAPLLFREESREKKSIVHHQQD